MRLMLRHGRYIAAAIAIAGTVLTIDGALARDDSLLDRFNGFAPPQSEVSPSPSPSWAATGVAIRWQLKNPFRFFADPSDTDRHRQALEWLTPEERQTPVLSSERRLARHHPMGWATLMKGATCWDTAQNRHRCPDGRRYLHPTSHVVTARLDGLGDAAGNVCHWQVSTIERDGPRRSRLQGRRKVTRHSGPCIDAVELDIPYPSGAEVFVESGTGVTAQTVIKVRDIFIVGLGDSFGSGEGNPDHPVRFSEKRAVSYGRISDEVVLAGYPARLGNWTEIGDRGFTNSAARWLDRACHRSLYAYQMRAALQLALEDPQRAITFAGFACSGAEITHGLFLTYKGNEWVESPPTLSQISAAAEAQCEDRDARSMDYPEAYHMRGRIELLKGGLVLRRCDPENARKIDLILLSIGGNDIGFARLVANAVLSDRTMLRRLGGWFGQVFNPSDVEGPLAELAYRYKALDRAIHNVLHVPWDETDRVILTAYPGMALLEDGKSVCPDGRLGMDVLPHFHLSAARALAGERIAGQLYAVMRKAAKARGWRLVDGHRRQFLGRGICARGNYFEAAEDLRLPRKLDGYWQPYNPASYQPYAPRARWFRTPNDAFLTGNFHVKRGLMRRVLRTRQLRWTQLLLAATYSGAFHPTAEGHAAIADEVVRQARQVLAKY
jgi:hypothetical protein